MASSTGFKQQCPSCEAMVTIRDPRLIGRKIDCPKCKYRFAVEEPAPLEEAETEDMPPAEKKPARKTPGGPKNGAGIKAPAKVKSAQKKDNAAEADEDQGGQKAGKKKKKAGAGENKMMLGMVLAGVGLVVLCLAGYFIFFSGTSAKKPPPSFAGTGPGTVPGNADKTGADDKASAKGKSKESKTGPGGGAPLTQAGVELTNLLLPDTDHVTHVHFKSILESDIGTALLREIPGEYFKTRLGFSLKNVESVIRTGNSQKGWSLNLVRLTDPIDLQDIKSALGGTSEQSIKGHFYYVANEANAWLNQLGRLTLNKAGQLRSPAQPRRIAVHVYDSRTLVFADEIAIKYFLEADRKPKQTSRKRTEAKEAAADKPNADADKSPRALRRPNRREGYRDSSGRGDEARDDKKEEPTLLEGAYLTVPPELGAMLVRLERPKEGEGEVLFVSAALRTGTNPGVKQFWDITQWFAAEPANIEVVGSVLLSNQDTRVYQYQNVLTCKDEAAAKELLTPLRDRIAPSFAAFFTDVTGIKIKDPREQDQEDKGDPMNPVPPPAAAEEKKPDKEETGIQVLQEEKLLHFNVKLALKTLKEKEVGRLKQITGLVIKGFQGELAVADASRDIKQRSLLRFRLAQGVARLGAETKGLPPGTLPRPPAKARSGYPWEPNKRVSWMVKLLPYVGQDTLARSVNPTLSWDDRENLVAARTLVPEFIDPSYAPETRYVAYPGTRIGVAATHYVGISGVGEDAADGTGDPNQWGIFGYERATPLAALERGASNTAVVIQVPPLYASPWLAGGGSTVRGVPEKQSIKPFVCVTGPSGERGTYVLMADGSVRFVSEKVSDEVLKAMCRIKGPAPSQDGWQLVPPP